MPDWMLWLRWRWHSARLRYHNARCRWFAERYRDRCAAIERESEE
jgi:hypothetical protein